MGDIVLFQPRKLVLLLAVFSLFIFTPAQADCGADFPDLVFQIIGQEFSIVRPIPTLNEWGMIAAAVILGFAGLGAFYVRRKGIQA